MQLQWWPCGGATGLAGWCKLASATCLVRTVGFGPRVSSTQACGFHIIAGRQNIKRESRLQCTRAFQASAYRIFINISWAKVSPVWPSLEPVLERPTHVCKYLAEWLLKGHHRNYEDVDNKSRRESKITSQVHLPIRLQNFLKILANPVQHISKKVCITMEVYSSNSLDLIIKRTFMDLSGIVSRE